MKYVIRGGSSLKGTLFVQGAKNAILPMITASLIPKKGQSIIKNVPNITDVDISVKIANSIGAKVTHYKQENVLVIDSSSVNSHILNSKFTSQSRASILFLAPILHRLKKVEFNSIGGCGLGFRGLDFHHNGFKRLGANVVGEYDSINMSADILKGDIVYLDTPSQTSTENLMMAACVAEGQTIIENAASEPEVVDFANFLSKMGARIHGVGTRTIIIEGVRELKAVEHTVMPDRLDAGPMMMAAFVTKGDVAFVGAIIDEMRILVEKLKQMGAIIEIDGELVRVRGNNTIKPINIISWPYPGFSTDFLPGVMALSCVAEGTSYFRENVFLDRFTQIEGLTELGAIITKNTHSHAMVEGVRSLQGSAVRAPDLRAGMSYVLAGLIAEGETIIDNIYQIERGHSEIDRRLQGIGANIQRVK